LVSGNRMNVFRNDPNEQQRHEVEQREQIEAPQPARLEEKDLAAHDARQDAHPEREQPPVQEVERPERDRGDRGDLGRREAPLRPHEGLPQDEDAEMREASARAPSCPRHPTSRRSAVTGA